MNSSPSNKMGSAISTVNESQDFWEKHYREYQVSGLDRKAYCREQSIPYYRFRYHYRKLEKAKSSNVIPKLMPVKLSRSPSSQSSDPIAQINTARGHQLLIYDRQWLKDLIESLL